jgi:hypothetical protein
MSERDFICVDCKRTMQIEDRKGLRYVSLVGVPAAKCCEKNASDGYTVTCAFVTKAA